MAAREERLLASPAFMQVQVSAYKKDKQKFYTNDID